MATRDSFLSFYACCLSYWKVGLISLPFWDSYSDLPLQIQCTSETTSSLQQLPGSLRALALEVLTVRTKPPCWDAPSHIQKPHLQVRAQSQLSSKPTASIWALLDIPVQSKPQMTADVPMHCRQYHIEQKNESDNLHNCEREK